MGCFESSVGVVLHRDQRVLLIRRAKGPKAGTWACPAGHWEPGESAQQTAVREVREEVGLTLDPDSLIGPWAFDRMPDECRHGATVHDWLVFECEIDDGQVPTRDLDETIGMRWVPLATLANQDLEPVWRRMLTTTGHLRAAP